MKRPLDETASVLERLADEVRELERRVRALETRASGTLPMEQRTLLPGTVLQPTFGLPPSLSIGLIPVLGKAVLGIAGAYLLRAAAESGAFPGPIAVALSAVYAAVWLVSSVKTRPDGELVRVVSAATAALIFFPMLWETTARFRVLPTVAAASLLIAFVVLGSALAWFRDLVSVMWITALPATTTAMVLMVATGELTPFIVTLLATCTVVESAAIRGRWAGIRPWVAIIADAGVWLMIYIAGLPQQLEAYRPVGRPTAVLVCFALLAIYGSSVGFRTAGLRHTISLFETGQMAAAFTFALAGALRLTQEMVAVGAFCMLSAGVLYLAAFARFSAVAFARNHRVYAICGLALLLTGSTLLLSGSAAAMLWSGVAVMAMFASAQTANPTLAIHGAIYLAASALGSGLLAYGRAAMTAAALPAPVGILWTVALAAVVSYAAFSGEPGNKWPRLAAASLAVFSALAFLVTVIVRFAGGTPSTSRLAMVRTLVTCAVALLVGVGGTRWKRIELVWISYASVALVTVKLIVEDFRESSPAALAISLLCYGAVLVFGPRLARLGMPRF